MEGFLLEEMVVPVCLAVVQGLGAGGVVVGAMNMFDRYILGRNPKSRSDKDA